MLAEWYRKYIACVRPWGPLPPLKNKSKTAALNLQSSQTSPKALTLGSITFTMIQVFNSYSKILFSGINFISTDPHYDLLK